MAIDVHRAEFQDVEAMRDIYRHEMNCQIIHDSIHARPGWTQEYLLTEDGTRVGYGSVAVSGPWKGNPTLYEYYVLPQHRSRTFDLFSELLKVCGSARIEIQSNDPFLTIMLHAVAQSVESEKILFHDGLTTSFSPPDAAFRRVKPEDRPQIVQHDLDQNAKWVVTVGDAVAGAGDILYHYNRPYGDIYMKVTEPFRRRGLGAYLVQELKKVCYEGGSVPAARCNPENIASRGTLQRAGFVPCGHILTGTVTKCV